MTERIRTGGTWDPAAPPIYFLASNVDRMQWGVPCHDHLLVAVNELQTEGNIEKVGGWIAAGKQVFIDSGIFWLTNEHARRNGVSMDAALALAPEEIDGFEDLWKRYLYIVNRYGDRAWGYIELDQGGRENKLRTRARLEAAGLRPIPVYHPLNDGWDYFDELATRYDRICFGNIVQADQSTRLRLLATLWERKCRYPDLWVHVLGMTPNEWFNAYPPSSSDSSTWLSIVRWDCYRDAAAGKGFGRMPKNFQYALGGDPEGDTGSRKAVRMASYGSNLIERNLRNHLAALRRLGCVIHPPEDTRG
jgi:hypothetical protein